MGKVFKNGNSLAVTVPTIYAHELRIEEGADIRWEKTDKGLLLVPDSNFQKEAQKIDPKVVDLIKKISKKYAGVWEDLSKV